MWVAFYTYANTIIVRGVGGALLTIADHKVLAIHMGIVFTHYKTKQRTKIVELQSHQLCLQSFQYFEVEETASCCSVLTQRIMQKNPNVGDKSQTYVHIWWLHCPPAACDIHHRTCVWRWRVSRNNEPLDSWSELWQCWSRQTPLISDIAHGPQSCKLCRKKGEF